MGDMMAAFRFQIVRTVPGQPDWVAARSRTREGAEKSLRHYEQFPGDYRIVDTAA